MSRLPALFQTHELSGVEALSARYKGSLSFGRGTRDARTLDIDAHPLSLYRLGLTVYLHNIEPFVPGAHDFLRGLERELGLIEGCARMAAFASPEGDGVSSHFDAEEVFSIQLQGTKTIEVAKVEELAWPWGEQYGANMLPFDRLYPQVPDGFPREDEAVFETIEMKPGSVLFMPRGLWHRTVASSNSLSVSVILRPPSALDGLLQQLQLLLLQDENWRRPLHGAWGDAAQRDAALAHARTLLGDLPRVIAALQPDTLVPQTEKQRIASITPATRFQRIPVSSLSVTTEAGRRVLSVRAWSPDWIEQETWSTVIAADYEPVFGWLAKRDAAFSAEELSRQFPRFPWDILREILAALVRAQFLRLLGFPLQEKPGLS
ncbi:MAG: cupin domain-containing protein [Parvibaculaceae bacterium]|nr:cupin domain-containing protein [Parvibaculaceae bacterium]